MEEIKEQEQNFTKALQFLKGISEVTIEQKEQLISTVNSDFEKMFELLRLKKEGLIHKINETFDAQIKRAAKY